MTTVTTRPADRAVWDQRLGDAFKRNCDKFKDPRVCLSHFPPSKANSPKSRVFPFKNGTPNRRTPGDDDSDSHGEETDTGELEDSEDEMEDVYRDPDYVPEEAEENEEEEIQKVSEKIDHFVCDFYMLQPSLSKCWECLRNRTDSTAEGIIQKQGASITARYKCVTCAHSWSFESSKNIDRKGKPGTKQKEVNLKLAVAILTTGNDYPKVASLFEVLEIPIFSEQRFHQLSSSLVKPAIEKFYKIQREEVMMGIKQIVDDGGEIHLAGDGQYDSRGFSAMICRFSLMDVATKYILDFEVSRKERGGNSMVLEKVGHETSLPRLLGELEQLTGDPNPVKSLTTDRCVNLTQAMKAFPNIKHYYDCWHWIRSIRKDINEKFRQQQFQPLRCWSQPFINHMHYSIANSNGDGDLAFQLIMGFFLHIQNQHDNFQTLGNLSFDKVDKCLHAPDVQYNRPFLDLEKKGDKKAFDVLLNIMNKGNRQKDLESVSPYFSTSALESFHGLAIRYLPKETFYDKESYIIRSLLATIHWNFLQLEEAKGNRKIESKVPYFCKTKKQIVFKSRKTSLKHVWRLVIYQLAVELLIQTDYDNDPEQDEIEARAEAEEAMYALD